MKKTNLTVSLSTIEGKKVSKVDGYINENSNSIIYIESDEKNTKTKFNYLENKLIRENEEILLELKFIENSTLTGKLLIKEYNKIIDLTVETTKLINTSKLIEIEYILNENKYLYIINMEE